MRSITHKIVHDDSGSDSTLGMFHLFLTKKWIILIVDMFLPLCYLYYL